VARVAAEQVEEPAGRGPLGQTRVLGVGACQQRQLFDAAAEGPEPRPRVGDRAVGGLAGRRGREDERRAAGGRLDQGAVERLVAGLKLRPADER
jgi:hypothetical protein